MLSFISGLGFGGFKKKEDTWGGESVSGALIEKGTGEARGLWNAFRGRGERRRESGEWNKFLGYPRCTSPLHAVVLLIPFSLDIR